MRPRYISTSRGAWEIGLVFSQTGRLANVGTSQLEGAILAIDEINGAGGIDGLPLSPVIRDDGSDPQRFLRLTDLMLREDGVSVVFGGSSPEARRTAAPMFERRNGLLFYSGLGEGFDFSPNVFCFGLIPNQACGRLLRETCGTGDIFIVYRQDMLSRGLRDCLTREIERAGATVAGEAAVSDQPVDIEAAVARVGASNASRLVLAMGAADSVAVLKALSARSERLIIATFGANEKDFAALRNVHGLLTVSTYCAGVASPVAKAFDAKFARRYGKGTSPNAFSEASYCATCLFALSLEQAGSIDSDDVRDALLGMSLRGPQGQVAVHPETNCAGLWPRILRWGAEGRFEIVAESSRAMLPDPFLIAPPDLRAL